MEAGDYAALVEPIVRVAVCTNRRPAEVAACLAALLRQVEAGRLVLVTSGLGRSLIDQHRASFAGELLIEPRTGLSRARNRALEGCSQDDVLAYVDDDALVEDGWWDALSRRWREAAAEVACIGGPIRPTYTVPAPSWLSPALLPVLSVLDMGDRVREVDPRVATVYGANISFRAGALRAAGGFDPAFGHDRGRVSFSEEDEAQRALARLGHKVLYVPDAGVRHLIARSRLTRRSFVRRRFAYGRTLGRRRVRTARLAARQALSSAVGCLAAALSGRDALAMERAVRSSENLGVVVELVLKRRRGG